MTEQISWFATGATILAALVTASNLGARITGYGFVIFLLGSIAWLAVGVLTSQPALLWTNAALTLLNIWGIWRWLGRQASLEKGSEAALEGSNETPGEALFPASMLGRTGVSGRDGNDLGQSIDAMIGANSGRIHYLVVSAGGVAGLGERLHRVDWRLAKFDQDAIGLAISKRELDAMPQIPRDDWPAR